MFLRKIRNLQYFQLNKEQFVHQVVNIFIEIYKWEEKRKVYLNALKYNF